MLVPAARRAGCHAAVASARMSAASARTSSASPSTAPSTVAKRLERAEELLASARSLSARDANGVRNGEKVDRNTVSSTAKKRARVTDVNGEPHVSALPRVAEASRAVFDNIDPVVASGVQKAAATAAKAADTAPRYDPEVAVEMFRNRVFHVRRRQLQIAAPLLTFVSRVVFDIQTGREESNRKRRAEEFLNVIASLGPAFIKAGQALSSRPDLLPPEYLEQLQKLQDRLQPFPNEVAFKLIEEELGKSVDEIFEYIEPVPIAAASIGQVYCARLRGTGEKVAVKVQRPDCEKIISLDIYILRNLTGTINRLIRVIGRDIDLQSIIEEFGKLIYEEIDYISEARNAERFLELYGDLPNVNVPRVFWRFTRQRVLTMEWMEGVRLTSVELSGSSSDLVRAMVQCSLRQMLENGYFHADTHLGNLLAHNGSLTYLDFGMMSMVEPKQRYGIIEAVVHMVNRDFEALSKLYVRLGFLPPDTDLQPIVKALGSALPDVLGASVGELNFKSVIDKLGSVMYQYPFRLPPYYTAVIRCLGVLEGVAIQVDPNFRILNESYPYIASRLLTDPAPELQEALQCLLFDSSGHPRWSRLESLLDSASTAEDYDISRAAEQLVSFLLSPKGKVIRYNLVDDLTNEIDTLGVDITKYYVSLIAQAGTSVGLKLPAVLAAMPSPQRTASMENLDKLSKLLTKSRGFSPRKLTPVIRRLLREPESQRLGLEVAVSLAEKFTSRAIRFAFGLPQTDTSTYAQDRQRTEQVF